MLRLPRSADRRSGERPSSHDGALQLPCHPARRFMLLISTRINSPRPHYRLQIATGSFRAQHGRMLARAGPQRAHGARQHPKHVPGAAESRPQASTRMLQGRWMALSPLLARGAPKDVSGQLQETREVCGLALARVRTQRGSGAHANGAGAQCAELRMRLLHSPPRRSQPEHSAAFPPNPPDPGQACGPRQRGAAAASRRRVRRRQCRAVRLRGRRAAFAAAACTGLAACSCRCNSALPTLRADYSISPASSYREQQLWDRQQAMYDRVVQQWDAERQVRSAHSCACRLQRFGAAQKKRRPSAEAGSHTVAISQVSPAPSVL